MKQQKYMTRQGGRYYFRRRIPGLSTALSAIFVSLGTSDPKFAHTWSRKLAAEFDELLDSFLFILEELPEEVMARYMTVCLQQCLSDMRRQHRMERMTGRLGSMSPDSRDMIRVAVETLLCDGIRKAFPASRINPEWSAKTLEAIMRFYRAEADAVCNPGMKDRLAKEFTSITGETLRSQEHMAQIIEAYLHARLAALSAMEDHVEVQAARFRDLSMQMVAETVTIGPDPSSASSTTNPSPALANPAIRGARNKSVDTVLTESDVLTPGVALIKGPLTLEALNTQFATAAACDEALHRSPKTQPFGIDIAGACERSIKIAIAAGKMDAKTADSRRAKIKMFCLLANVQTVAEIEQFHLRIFADKIDRVPVDFNKSSQDKTLTLREICARADGMPEAKLGRAPGTFNAHLDNIGAVLTHALKNEGNSVDPMIDTSLLRRNETERARKKRNAFRPAEARALFQHPTWQGCKSESRRHDPGQLVLQDGLYFVPLIVAYTGGRMEEIAGLPVDAIIATDGHYGFDIRPHDERRLKNLQSERLIPVHDHLIELGILVHQERMQLRGEKYLFPELQPTSSKKKFTSALRYNWEKIRDIQLDGNPRKLDGHSLRHSFNHLLKLEKSISKEVRLDILGHAGGHCCTTLTMDDSQRESMRLEGLYEQATSRPLP
ncbi:DUF6538 domain-containing protein, partial [Puniceibacterium sediminis]